MSARRKLAYVTTRFPFVPAPEQFFEPEVVSLAGYFDVYVVPARATDTTNYYPHMPVTALFIGFLDWPVFRDALKEFARAPGAVLHTFARIAFGRCARAS